MMLQGCCPPLALPRTHLGGEIIGFEPKTGQFVQAAAGGPPARVSRYPYSASAGLGSTVSTLLWGGMALVLVAAIVVAVQEQREVYK